MLKENLVLKDKRSRMAWRVVFEILSTSGSNYIGPGASPPLLERLNSAWLRCMTDGDFMEGLRLLVKSEILSWPERGMADLLVMLHDGIAPERPVSLTRWEKALENIGTKYPKMRGVIQRRYRPKHIMYELVLPERVLSKPALS